MQFNAKDDFVNEYEQELQAELDAETKLEVEQDHDYDRVDYVPTSDDEEQLKKEQEEAEEEEDELPDLSNPMVEYSSQDELDRVTNRESYEQFKNFNMED